jgi:heme exporter protein B
MFNTVGSIIWHEMISTLRQAYSWLTPLLFFVIVVCLFPLALGPDTSTLNKIAPGIIWVAILLANVMSVENIFKSDAESGHLDLLLLSPQPLTLLVLAKVISHWLTTGLPLIILSPVLGLLLGLPPRTESALIITLFFGTPVLSLLGAIGAGLLVGVHHHGLLLPVLIMPLYIPVLIFGTGTMLAATANLPLNGNFAMMGALLLGSLAFAPLLTGLALQTGVNQ